MKFDSILLAEFFTAIGPLFLALVLGSIVGIQRELSGHQAGLRTNTLVCVGSALAMVVSIKMHTIYGSDAGRIAAQVISGIGFLGAGTIIRTGLSVRGLTTAAGLWVTACIGLAVGARLYVPAIMGTICCLIVMGLMEWVEKRAVQERRRGICHLVLEVENLPGRLETIYQELLKLDENMRLDEIRYIEKNQLEINVFIHTENKKDHGNILQILSQIEGVRKLAVRGS